jgi:hypothetical protein
MQAANAKFLQEKLERNLKAFSLDVVVNGDVLEVAGMDISLIPHTVASPMGGIDSQISPFLGVGAVPSFIKVDAKAALADAFNDADKIKALSVVVRFANTVKIYNAAAELLVLEGHPDLKVVGQ